MGPAALTVHLLPGVPEIRAGDDLAALLASCMRAAGWQPQPGDVLALAQKIVSKAEGRLVPLASVTPSAAAVEVARRASKDPRVAELVLRESRALLRVVPGVIIAEHRLGVVLANAGIDRSNIGTDEDCALLLPEDPDRSARELRARLEQAFGVRLAVVITDSVGRPWRLGTTGIAIGCAGLTALHDLRGRPDRQGRALQVSETAVADSAASAAVLAMGEGAESTPVALLRGLASEAGDQPATALLRPPGTDLFR